MPCAVGRGHAFCTAWPPNVTQGRVDLGRVGICWRERCRIISESAITGAGTACDRTAPRPAASPSHRRSGWLEPGSGRKQAEHRAPRADDRALLPELRIALRRARFARVLISKPRRSCMRPYSMPLCTILTKCCAGGPQCSSIGGRDLEPEPGGRRSSGRRPSGSSDLVSQTPRRAASTKTMRARPAGRAACRR